ncbi:MAG: hypothetical protein ACREM8_13195 [Vulcanimicrobiaceae bacterium]
MHDAEGHRIDVVFASPPGEPKTNLPGDEKEHRHGQRHERIRRSSEHEPPFRSDEHAPWRRRSSRRENHRSHRAHEVLVVCSRLVKLFGLPQEATRHDRRDGHRAGSLGIGLAEEVVAADVPMTDALAFVRRVAAKPPRAIGLAKLVSNGDGLDFRALTRNPSG